MFIATNQIKFKLLAVVVIMALIVPMVMMPAGAAQAKENIIVPMSAESALSEEIIKMAEKFLQKNEDGTIVLNMPEEMKRKIGKDAYQQLQAGVDITSKMIADGYLKADESFNLHVTKKYTDEVKANMRALSQNLQMKGIFTSNISVFSERNSVIINFSIHNKMSTTSIENGGGGGVAGGVNKVVWHWWGFKLYLSDEVVDAIVYEYESVAAIAALIASVAPGLPKKIAGVIAALLYYNAQKLSYANRNNTGVIIYFEWLELPHQRLLFQKVTSQ